MEAIELIELINEYKDWKVKIHLFEEDDSEWGMKLRVFEITGIQDLGHSDKQLILDVKETNKD